MGALFYSSLLAFGMATITLNDSTVVDLSDPKFYLSESCEKQVREVSSERLKTIMDELQKISGKTIEISPALEKGASTLLQALKEKQVYDLCVVKKHLDELPRAQQQGSGLYHGDFVELWLCSLMSLKAQVAKEMHGGRNVSVYAFKKAGSFAFNTASFEKRKGYEEVIVIDRVFRLKNKNYLIVIAQSNLYIWGKNRKSLSDFRECLKQSKELKDSFGVQEPEVASMLFQDMKVRP